MVSDWRQRQKDELRQLLYETAVELFAAEGYEQTTVQQITERVGVAKGTFFNHFPTKLHVVEEWYNRVTFESLERAHQRGPATAEVAVCDLCVDLALQATEAPELMLAKTANSSHPALAQAEQTQDTEIDAYVAELCQAGKDRGELVEDLDVDFFTGLLGSVLTGSSRAWVQSQPRFDFPHLLRRRLTFLFRAAASRS